MASGLEEEWKRLKLTKEEEDIIICDEEDPSEKAEQFKYVKVLDLCYACGKSGHVYKDCALFDENIPVTELQYGDFLRASPLKPKGKTTEADLMEERRLVQASRNKKKSSQATKKLAFRDSSYKGAASPKARQKAAHDEVAQMLIDESAAAMENRNLDELGEFLAVLWECWNARNHFIFETPDKSLAILGARTISFVRSCRASHACETEKKSASPALWKPPESGWFKLNFDGGKNGESGRVWGFVVHSCDGDIILAGVDKAADLQASKLKKPEPACLD
ncbi:hypothetical protein Cgig2_010160 [Carnegiea gigantea]|uniref:CCHC-type domain-containing protein n=1 Tax=Carnegiea gigantea TaxID=171969 RepID=A0A9Q1QKA5_9CARY|nr:hypothetical protein Cgig2_010160 [Carnegiea gigantea]